MVLAGALVLLVLAGACGQDGGAPGETPPVEPTKVSDLVPAIQQEDCVLGFSCSGPSDHYGILYVRGNGQQSKRALELLDQFDLSGAERVEEKEGVTVAGYHLYAKWKDDGCQIDLRADVNPDGTDSLETRRLRFRFDSGEAFYLKGISPPASEVLTELNDIEREVLFSEADWAAVYSPLESEKRSCTVTDVITALEFLENRIEGLEDTPAEFDPGEGGYEFDCRITVEDTDCVVGSLYNNLTDEMKDVINPPLSVEGTEYWIDTKTGVFMKKTLDSEAYYKFPNGLPTRGFRQILPELLAAPKQ